MTVREYIGARYVPLYIGVWDNTVTYEPLSIVSYQGASYVSRQAVPIGIEITNTQYWLESANYNAQVEQYRQEVLSVMLALPTTEFDSENTVKDYIDSVNAKLGSGFDDTHTIAAAISSLSDIIGEGFDSTNNISAVLGSGFDSTNNISAVLGSGFDSTNTVKAVIDSVNAKFGNGFDSTNTVKAKFDKITAKNRLFLIGDSYMANTTTIEDALNRTTKYNVVNYAVAGTGFLADALASGMTFINQLTKIYNDYPDISKDDMILVYGGVNDYSSNQTLSSMLTAVSAFYTSYQSKAVKPRLSLVFCNAPNHYNGNSTFIQWQANIKASLGRLNIPVVQYSEYWLIPEQSTVWGADQHPNSTGCNVIAAYLSQIVNGEYTGVHREVEVNLNGNSGLSASYAKCYAKFDNGTICLQPNLNGVSGSGSGSYQAFVIPFKPCFGLNNQSPAIAPIVEDNAKAGTGGGWGELYWLYNTAQSIVYLINPNSETLSSRNFISGSIITYSPTLNS